MAQPMVSGDRIWCPQCNRYEQFVKIRKAAKLVDVHDRTIYRYIDEGAVYTFRVVGKSYRVCTSCLVRQVC